MKAGLGAVAAFLALSSLSASTSGPATNQRFRAGVDAVPVDVLVTRGGRSVAGLTAADFELKDNGVVQEILATKVEDVPLTLMLVLDVSESVAGEPLEHLRSAIAAATDALTADDHVALFTFSHHVALATEATRDFGRLRSASLMVAAGGATALHDATLAALVMRQRVAGRAVMLVFSDGDDTVSWMDPRDVLAAAQRSDVVVYGVALRRQSERRDAQAVVRDRLEQGWFRQDPSSYRRQFLPLLAAETGGVMLTAERLEHVRDTLVRVVSEFESRYVLMYTPRGVAPDGWHTIDVRLKGQRGEVRARRGYLR